MVYIKRGKKHGSVIKHIEDVLNAHEQMLKERDSDANILNKKVMSEYIKKDLHRVLQEEKNELNIKIAAIKYTLDYVKLMSNISQE